LPKKTPQYNLDDIKAAAKVGNIVMTPLSEKDALNLGYDEEERQKCLISLTRNDYFETKDYEFKGRVIPHDVYQPNYLGPSDQLDKLYIKLSIKSNWILIVSFHLQRYG